MWRANRTLLTFPGLGLPVVVDLDTALREGEANLHRAACMVMRLRALGG